MSNLSRIVDRGKYSLQRVGIAVWLLAGLVVVLSALVGKFAWVELPPQAIALTDRWAEEGTIFGFGGFVLAVLATVIAVVAYGKSIQRAQLEIEDHYEASIIRSARGATWTLGIRLNNKGNCAARSVAVKVTFENAEFDFLVNPDWRQVPGAHHIIWEGGGTYIHQGWDEPLPDLTLHSLKLRPGESRIKFDIDAICDSIKGQPNKPGEIAVIGPLAEGE